jgi:EAL domain-containing protein (putative c-di-GMP-specific phosphodiesterase class I)
MLSVNLSGQSFSDQDVLDFIVERIRASGIRTSSLCFEITETAAIPDFTSALPFITNRGLRLPATFLSSGPTTSVCLCRRQSP